MDEVINKIKEAVSQLEGGDLVEKEKIPEIKTAVEEYFKEPSSEASRRIEMTLRSANAHLETEDIDNHLLEHHVEVNGDEKNLSDLTEKLGELNLAQEQQELNIKKGE